MMKVNDAILVVEDDAAIARLIEINLQKAGYKVFTCKDGNVAMRQLQERSWQLVILDRMLPGKSGMQILRWLNHRKSEARVPVLMVTALGSTPERVQGLNEGADDYLPKPFEPEELVARVGAIVRRSSGVQTQLIEYAGIILDPEAPEIHVHGSRTYLRPLEFRLLHTLIKKPGKVRSREYLLDHVWGRDTFVEPRTVDATVKRLRSQLADHGAASCIETVRGLGYRFMMAKEDAA